MRQACLALLLLLTAGVACDKQEAPAVKNVAASDHVAPSPVGTTQAVLARNFNLRVSATFPFEIPAHAAQPHLHGIFQSFAGQGHGVSDETANIDFLILNEDQQAQVTSGHPSEALLSVEASHSQSVNLDLPPSMNVPVKYYLVFRNPDKSAKVVEANFRVDF